MWITQGHLVLLCHQASPPVSPPGSGTWDGGGDTHRAVRRDLGHNLRPGPVCGEAADAQSWGREISVAPSCAPAHVPAPAPLSSRGTRVSSWTGPFPGLRCGSDPPGGFRLPCEMAPGSAARPCPTPQHPERFRLPWDGTRVCCQTLSHPTVPTGSLCHPAAL